MKRYVVVISFLAVCLLTGVLIFSGGNKEYETINPAHRDIKNEIELSGKIQAKDIFAVKNIETSEIEYVYVKAGDTVKKGDILYTLSDGGLKQQLEKLKETQTASATAPISNDLFKSAQSGMSYEQFNSAVEKSKATEASTSSSSQLQSQIEQLEEKIEAKNIRSAIDGTVVAINVKKGEIVFAGENSATIANVEKKYIIAYVMQQDYNNVKEGMQVTLQDEQTGLDITGTVTFKDIIAKESTDTDSASQYKLEIEPDDTMKNAIGSSVSVFICIEKRENTLSILLSCVVKSSNSTYVYIKKDGVIKKTEVETGLRDDEYIEILSGLSETDEVLSDPSEYSKETD